MRCRIAGIVVVFALLLLASAGAGQGRTLRANFDAAVLDRSLRDVINTGADLFNIRADYAGCYRLFQGSLQTIKPLMPDDVQADIGKALAEAEQKAAFADRAYRLRSTLDAVRAHLKSPATAAPTLPNEIDSKKPVSK
jgi:hypothetical protein